MKNDDIKKSTEIEYNALKAEQRQRISTRDNMLYLQIVSIVGLATVFEEFSINVILIALPFISIILGWKYYINDLKVTEIAEYFRKIAVEEDIFAFEIWVKKSPLRRIRKYLELALKTIIFVVPAILGSTYSLFFTESHMFLKSASAISGIFGLLLIIFFLSAKDT